MLNFVWIET